MFELLETSTSLDRSQKFLWKCADNSIVESVLLPRKLKSKINDRWTACISSQVGCAMGCEFCATGKLKLTRNLSEIEIVSQVIELRKIQNVTNIVFMGMGEPLQNMQALKGALNVFYKKFAYSRRKIIVSTSGWIPGILELAKELRPRLAISLNATTNEFRTELMPVNKKFPMSDLIEAGKHYSIASNLPVILEYVLLSGLNDSIEDSARLVEIAKNWNCQVNLIPYNKTSGVDFVRPDLMTIKRFQHALVSCGITATVRFSGGDDVNAACGQLSRTRISNVEMVHG